MTTYTVVLALHVMAVITAFGLPLAAPMVLPYLRRAHPRTMPAIHDVQHRMNLRVTGPATILFLAFGIYMASDRDLWGETWVEVPIAIVVVIAIVGGWIVGALKRLAALARADVEAAPPGAPVAWSRAYETLYAKYMTAESGLGVLVLVAIFFMAAKPFS